LKLERRELLSRFAFNFNLRRNTLAKQAEENPDRKKFDRHAPKVRQCKLPDETSRTLS